MIVDCPNCGKRISNRYSACPHCKLRLDETANEGLSQEEASRREGIRRRYRVQAQAYASILLALIGVVWAYASSDGMEQAPGLPPVALFVAGGLWYFGLRVYMIFQRVRA